MSKYPLDDPGDTRLLRAARYIRFLREVCELPAHEALFMAIERYPFEVLMVYQQRRKAGKAAKLGG